EGKGLSGQAMKLSTKGTAIPPVRLRQSSRISVRNNNGANCGLITIASPTASPAIYRSACGLRLRPLLASVFTTGLKERTKQKRKRESSSNNMPLIFEKVSVLMTDSVEKPMVIATGHTGPRND